MLYIKYSYNKCNSIITFESDCIYRADVERLIGEGAVRTVKKPTQIKRQLLTTQSPIFFSKNESTNDTSMSNENKITSNENEKIQEKEYVLEETPCPMKNSNLNLGVKRVPNIIYATDEKQPDVTYVMMDDCSVNMGMYLKIIIIK